MGRGTPLGARRLPKVRLVSDNERMSVAEYKALLERGEKPKGKPRRGAEAGNPYRGLTCRHCGLPVKTTDSPTDHHAAITEGKARYTVEHLECRG